MSMINGFVDCGYRKNHLLFSSAFSMFHLGSTEGARAFIFISNSAS